MTDQTSRYDSFEDTGDWPFRDAPPRDEEPSEERAGSLFAAAAEPAGEPVELAEEVGVAAVGLEEDDEVLEESPPMESVDEAVELPEPEEPEEPEPDEAEEPEPEEHGPEELEPEVPELPAAVEHFEHAEGDFLVPGGPVVLEGGPHGFRRSVAVVVSRFNGDVTSRLLESAVAALRDCNVADDAITVVPVPGAFELPLAALALAKTRRFSCIVALGCVVRGETPHFDLVAGEAASGLQLAAIETGIPVSFGVLACETKDQALARVDRGAEAARTGLEMADLFSHVRTRAASA
jgi:6,7-dimethyl-8-ribityllumazine synthase